MKFFRIYYPNNLMVGDNVQLNRQTAHRLKRVLRFKVGQTIIVFNGTGGEYLAEITALTKDQAIIAVYRFVACERESSLKIHLGQGLCRGERMEFVIQKSVELGVTEITPLLTEYCNVKLDHDRKLKRIQHWQAVVISACEQSGRCLLPVVHPPCQLITWVEQLKGTNFICDPKCGKGLEHYQLDEPTINLLIGPEGGVSDTDIELALTKGFKPIVLGPRVLRTETAALTGISLLQYRWGDLG